MEYYQSKDIESIDFYTIYKELFSNKKYYVLSSEAKWLYVILVDKLSIAQTDTEGNLYLTSVREEIQELLGISVNTVTKAFKELARVDLISEGRKGFSELKRTYVKALENVDIIHNRKNSENINMSKINLFTEQEIDIAKSYLQKHNLSNPRESKGFTLGLYKNSIKNFDFSKYNDIDKQMIEALFEILWSNDYTQNGESVSVLHLNNELMDNAIEKYLAIKKENGFDIDELLKCIVNTIKEKGASV